MIFFKKQNYILIFLLFFLNFSIFSQNLPLFFYGILSNDADENMLGMTEDMFLKQLRELNPNVADLRLSKDDFKSFYTEQELNDFFKINPSKSIIFARISKTAENEGKWNCKIYLKYKNQPLEIFEKDYDSYYKILMESKDFLQEIFNSKKEPSQQNAQTPKTLSGPLTTEILSGTWKGEDFINKIVIMRGGRGFIIFKNGASMNISVKIEGNTVHITQTSSSNASFYPELPREAALKIATFAKPIEWFLSYSNGTLSGTKHTVSLNSSNVAEESNINVIWIKNL